MMDKNELNFERTKAGLQFVIPGTEKPKTRKRHKYAKDDRQLVIPGAEKISDRALASRMIEKPFTPRLGQRTLNGTPLFGAQRPK